jgi:DNA repair exonuclease SbcCD nuclease subunit
MTTKFLHTADWQIGKNYDRVSNNDKRGKLRQARLDSLEKLGEIARAKEARFVLAAGDLFDSPTSDKDTLAAGLGVIGKIGIPVYAIPGNHDHGGPAGFWETDYFLSQKNDLAPNLTVLLKPEPFETETAWILPCPLMRRADASDPTAWIRTASLGAIQTGTKPVLLLAHGSTQSFGGGSGYGDEEGEEGSSNLIRLAQLPAGLVDYAALGDWHGTKEIEPWAFYSGTHEPDRFAKGGDHDPGNVLWVEVARGRQIRIEKIRTALTGWHDLNFEFTDDNSLDLLEQIFAGLFGDRVNKDLLQLKLTGRLGLEARSQLNTLLDKQSARLLRVKLDDGIRVSPTEAEIHELADRTADPLIGLVAQTLVEKSRQPGGEAEIASLALQELFAAVHTN